MSSELFVPMVAEALGKTVAATADETIGATASETPATSVEMTLPSGSVLRWPGCDLNELAEAIAALEARLC